MTRMAMSMMTITLTVTSTPVTTATAVVTFLPTHSHSVHQFPHHIIRQGWQVGGTLTVLRHHLDQEEHDAGGKGRGRGGAGEGLHSGTTGTMVGGAGSPHNSKQLSLNDKVLL